VIITNVIVDDRWLKGEVVMRMISTCILAV